MIKQTKAGELAKLNPHQRIPDSEINIENIIPGSPEYVPYKRIKGKGSKGPKLKNTIHDSDMARTNQTLKLSEMTAEEKKAHDKKARDHRADLHANVWHPPTRIGRQPREGKPHVSS